MPGKIKFNIEVIPVGEKEHATIYSAFPEKVKIDRKPDGTEIQYGYARTIPESNSLRSEREPNALIFVVDLANPKAVTELLEKMTNQTTGLKSYTYQVGIVEMDSSGQNKRLSRANMTDIDGLMLSIERQPCIYSTDINQISQQLAYANLRFTKQGEKQNWPRELRFENEIKALEKYSNERSLGSDYHHWIGKQLGRPSKQDKLAATEALRKVLTGEEKDLSSLNNHLKALTDGQLGKIYKDIRTMSPDLHLPEKAPHQERSFRK